MRQHKIASQILLIVSIFNFVFAVPIAVREINGVRVNAVDAATVGMAMSEKRMDPGDRWSTNAGYLTDEEVVTWRTISSDSTGSSSVTSPELDTATSTPPQSPQPASDHPPPQSPQPVQDHPPPQSPQPVQDHPPPQSPQPVQDHPPPQSPQPVQDHPPPQSPQPVQDHPPPQSPQPGHDHPPPQSPQPAPANSHPPPPNPGQSTGPHQLTDDHSPPSTGPEHPGAPEPEKFLSKLMKGKFKRRISGYGPWNVVQRELQGTVGPSADLDKLFNGPVASASSGVIGRGAGTPSHNLQGDLQSQKKSVSRGLANLNVRR